MRITFAFLFALAGSVVTAAADEKAVIPPVTYSTDMSFEDAMFSVENAIIGAGLVIEGQSHVGEMLARTKDDVGGTKDLFTHAELFTFCSAAISRQVMEADLTNLQFCPYSIFVYQTPDKPDEVVVGFQDFGGSMTPARYLLDQIVKDALMLE